MANKTTTPIPMKDFEKSNRKLPWRECTYGENPVSIRVFADLQEYDQIAFCIDWKDRETEQVSFPLEMFLNSEGNTIKFPMQMPRATGIAYTSRSDVNGSLDHLYEITFDAKAIREKSIFQFKIDYFCALGDPRTPSGRKSRAKIKAPDLTFNVVPEFTLLKPKLSWLDRLLKRNTLWVNPIVYCWPVKTMEKEGV